MSHSTRRQLRAGDLGKQTFDATLTMTVEIQTETVAQAAILALGEFARRPLDSGIMKVVWVSSRPGQRQSTPYHQFEFEFSHKTTPEGRKLLLEETEESHER